MKKLDLYSFNNRHASQLKQGLNHKIIQSVSVTWQPRNCFVV